MTDEQQAGFIAETQHQKSVFRGGIVFIKELHSELVVEDRLRLFERHAVFFLVRNRFCRIPFELDHKYIVCTTEGIFKRA